MFAFEKQKMGIRKQTLNALQEERHHMATYQAGLALTSLLLSHRYQTKLHQEESSSKGSEEEKKKFKNPLF